MKRNRRITYNVLLAAKSGDPEAMSAILQHFDKYIEMNSYHPEIEGHPNSGGGVNAEIKARIQEKLMYQIIYDFDPTKLPKGAVLKL